MLAYYATEAKEVGGLSRNPPRHSTDHSSDSSMVIDMQSLASFEISTRANTEKEQTSLENKSRWLCGPKMLFY